MVAFQDVAPPISFTNTAAFPPLYCKNESVGVPLGQGCRKGESPLLFQRTGWGTQQCHVSPDASEHPGVITADAGPPQCSCIYWLVTASAVAGRLPVASLLTLPARAIRHILTSKFSSQEPGRKQKGRGERESSQPCLACSLEGGDQEREEGRRGGGRKGLRPPSGGLIPWQSSSLGLERHLPAV